LKDKQVIDENLHYKTLLKMVTEGKIDTEEKGLYRLPDIYLDEWFVLQYRFPKGIFSKATPLSTQLSPSVPPDVKKISDEDLPKSSAICLREASKRRVA